MHYFLIGMMIGFSHRNRVPMCWNLLIALFQALDCLVHAELSQEHQIQAIESFKTLNIDLGAHKNIHVVWMFSNQLLLMKICYMQCRSHNLRFFRPMTLFPNPSLQMDGILLKCWWLGCFSLLNEQEDQTLKSLSLNP